MDYRPVLGPSKSKVVVLILLSKPFPIFCYFKGNMPYTLELKYEPLSQGELINLNASFGELVMDFRNRDT